MKMKFKNTWAMELIYLIVGIIVFIILLPFASIAAAIIVVILLLIILIILLCTLLGILVVSALGAYELIKYLKEW